MILIEQAITCILHMENRVGEKILKLLIIAGANNRDSDKSALTKMIEQVKSGEHTNNRQSEKEK